MTIGVLPNPVGAGYFDGAPSIGNYHQTVKVDPNSAALPIGTVVELEGYAGPGTTNPPNVPLVQASSETADYLVLGVIVDGQRIGQATSIAGGSLAVVLTAGIAQVLCDATTTVGASLIQSASHTGTAAPGSATTAPLAVALQAVTINSGTALVWAYIAKGGIGGTAGPQGATGTQGYQGSTGAQGTQGNTGAQGATGTQGSQGAAGAQGTQGSNGAQGSTGTQGTQGPQGPQGIHG
jgi:hypothetical protein